MQVSRQVLQEHILFQEGMVFLSGGITHASFGGIGIGYFAGINPVIGAAVFGIMSALGVEYLSVRQKIREDSAIGILWAFGMAVGIIFIYLTPGYTPNLMSYLFGSILTVTNADIIALGIMSLILILILRDLLQDNFIYLLMRSMQEPILHMWIFSNISPPH